MADGRSQHALREIEGFGRCPPESERPMITVKLPDSHDHGLTYPDAHPTGYGLGKHGWVTIPLDGVPEEETEVLLDFVEESYRAVATKTLVKRLDAEINAQHDERGS